ncbi:uncharacterized protein [Littorina saxatilis]|uniref:Uncharacterized protein n=1 Tax=Littorina saxatilis TaxID=31220 RepID=A0AAN9BZH2_9CAEN
MSPHRPLSLLLLLLGCFSEFRTEKSGNSPPVTKQDAVPAKEHAKDVLKQQEKDLTKKAKGEDSGQKTELIKLIQQLEDAHKDLKQEVSNTEHKESELVNGTLQHYHENNKTIAELKEIISKLQSKSRRQEQELAQTTTAKAQLKKQFEELIKDFNIKLQEGIKKVSTLTNASKLKEVQLTRAEQQRLQEADSRILQLNATVSQCRDEKLGLEKSVRQGSGWIAHLNESLHTCAAQNSILVNTNAQCQKQYSDLKHTALQFISKVSTLVTNKAQQRKVEVTQAGTKIQELQAKNKDLKKAVMQCNGEKTTLQKTKSQSDAKNEELSTTVQNCTAKGASLSNAGAQYAKEKIELNKELQSCRYDAVVALTANAQCINQIAVLKSQVKERDDALLQTKDQLKEVNINITLRITQCSSQKEDIQKALETCNAVNLDYHGKILQCMKNYSEMRQAYKNESETKDWKFEHTLEEWYAVSRQLLNKSKRCEKERATLQTTAAQLLTQNSALVTAVSYCNGEIAQFNRTATQLTAENAVLLLMSSQCAKASEQYDYTLKRCQARTADLSGSVEKLQEHTTALNKMASKKDVALAKAHGSIQDLSAKNVILQHAFQVCRKDGAELSKSVAGLIFQNTQLESRVKQLGQETLELKTGAAQLLAIGVALNEAVAQSEGERTKQKQVLEQCSNDKHTLQTSMSNLRSENSELNASVSQCQVDKSKLKAAAAILNTRISDLSNSASLLQQENCKLNSTATQCARDNLDLRSVIVQLETDKVKLNRSLIESHENSFILQKTAEQCYTDKDGLRNSVQELTLGKSKLSSDVAQCREEKSGLEKTCEDLISGKDSLERKIAACEKKGFELNSKFARVQEKYAELKALQEIVGLGESCSNVTVRCSEGLACSGDDESVCVPVCNRVLAPDVLNAEVTWEGSGSSYRGSITCIPDAYYSGTDQPSVYCNDTGIEGWVTAMEGHCDETTWYNFTAAPGPEYVIPFTPEAGWSACVVATPLKTEDSSTIHFRIDLKASDNSTLMRMKTTVDTDYEDDLSCWSTVFSSKRADDKSYKDYDKNFTGNFPIDGDQILMEITASSETQFTVKVKGDVHATYDLSSSPLHLATTRVSKFRVSGDLFVSSLNLRCHPRD